jgi:hypothetical protein
MKTREGQRMGRKAAHGATVLGLAVALAGCDSLLDVTLPGQLLEENLDNPVLAETLARSVEGDFECAFGSYLSMTGLWTTDFWFTDQQLVPQQINQRSPAVQEFPEGGCGGNSIWLPLNVARVQGEKTIERILGWAEADVKDRSYLLAKSFAYSGYSTLLMGEAMCEVAFDSGPLQTRQDAWRKSIASLTSALQHATQSNHPDAASIANMARVGLARAHLNLGEGAKVLEFARAVPATFVRTVSASEADTRRYNRLYTLNGVGRTYTVATSYLNLTVNGVPDPRVRVRDGGGPVGFDRITPIWYQLKYTARSSPMPFATGREAQLMIAEVQGGQEAVGIINALRATHSRPTFASTDAAAIRAQVIEERRRELWLQGTRLGDMLRLGIPFSSGTLPRGSFYGPLTCVPLPEAELLANPNLGAGT